MLICTAKTFDPRAWATDLQLPCPSPDLRERFRVASAHKAAVIIYLTCLLLSMCSGTRPTCDFESLVTEIVENLSMVTNKNSLYTAITWPTFIAGAETNSVSHQQFVMVRLEHQWELEPWGLYRKAAEVLQIIWKTKNRIPAMEDEQIRDGDWIQYLRARKIDWLIL